MKLTFKKLIYKNLMSVGAKAIEVDLVNDKKVLITGKNGGGKSTMLEALCFALFGKPFRNIKKNQLINTINKKGLLVELWFSDGKNEYYIKRGIKPNIFEIKKNNEEVTESASVKDFQLLFETDILKMNIQSFKQTIILGTAGYTPFMELPAGQRRTLIEDLINLTIYSKMDQLNKSVVKEIKQQMDALEIKLTGLRNEHSAHQVHIEKQKTMSSTFIDGLKNAYKTHLSNAQTINNDIKILNEMLSDVILGDDVTGSITKYRHALALLDAKVNQIETTKSFFHSHDTCPTCKQSIQDDWKGQVVSELDTELTTYKTKSISAKDSLSLLEESYKSFKEQQKKIDKISSDIGYQKQSLALEITAARNLKAQIEQSENTIDIDTSRVDQLSKEIEQSRNEKTDLFEEMYARKIVLNMLKDSGIKAIVMKRYIPIINKKINEYLKSLGADYTFTLDQEFNEIIKSRGREDFSYTSFSQGEKARIDLALLFTWRDVASVVSGTEINLLVLDEVFDGAFDDEAIKRVSHIIDGMTDKNVFIISHKDHNPDDYNRHLKMVKVGRFTTMTSN